MGKGEIARYEQFLLFPQCFLKTVVKNQGLFGKGLRSDIKFSGVSGAWPRLAKATVISKLVRSKVEAEPQSSVGSAADLRTGGRWFDPPGSANILSED